MVEQDLASWEGKKDRILDLYRENRGRVEWAAAAEVFGQLLVQWMAGAQGMRTGIDMTGVKFSPQDWSKRFDHLLDEAKLELSDMEKRREADTHRVDSVNRAIADWRKRRTDAAGDISTFEGKASLAEADAKNRKAEKAQESEERRREHRERMAAEWARIGNASKRIEETDPNRAARVRLLQQKASQAEKDLSAYEAGLSDWMSADEASGKDRDKIERTARAKIASAAATDPAVQEMLKTYDAAVQKELTSPSTWITGSGPRRELTAALQRHRDNLRFRQERAMEEAASAVGLEPSAPTAASQKTSTSGGVVEGTRAVDQATGTKIIYRGGQWVEDK